MPDRDLYAAWKRRRAEVAVPDDFADRVMITLRLGEQGPVPRLARLLRGLFGTPAFRFGICSLACAVGLLRILHVIVFFLAEHASR